MDEVRVKGTVGPVTIKRLYEALVNFQPIIGNSLCPQCQRHVDPSIDLVTQWAEALADIPENERMQWDSDGPEGVRNATQNK